MFYAKKFWSIKTKIIDIPKVIIIGLILKIYWFSNLLYIEIIFLILILLLKFA